MLTPQDIFSAHVPRYTSYPTAPHFHAGVTQTQYRGWLAQLPVAQDLSLYFHIPFCDTLCWFCACHTTVVNRHAPVRDYLERLLTEIAMVAAALPGRRRVTHIHWGGGSPTMLTPDDMRRLSDATALHFEVAPDAEFAVEIDPRGFTAQMADALAACGVTRVSLGLQDSNARVQQAINRIQPMAEVEHCVRLLRSRGVTSVNVDLVYGLPYQTPESFSRTVSDALSLAPQRMAVFGYAHVPDFKKHQSLIPVEALPDVSQRLALAELGESLLLAAGYDAIGLDHFALADDSMARAARGGTLQRNFQGYTVDPAQTLIGLGASSISSLPQGYVQALQNIPAWRAALEAGELPVARGIALTDEDRLRRAVMESLMTSLQVDLGAICARHGRAHDALDWALADLRPLAEAGAVTVHDRTVTIHPRMKQAARLACAVFDAYLGTGQARHAQTA